VNICTAVQPGRITEKKGRERTVKKSQSGNISSVWAEALTVPIITQICTVASLPDLITCAKTSVEISRGYDFTGCRISHYSTDFRMGLTTVQRSCAACDTQRFVCPACDAL